MIFASPAIRLKSFEAKVSVAERLSRMTLGPVEKENGVSSYLCADQLETSTPSPLPQTKPRHLNIWRLERSNSRPSDQNSVQMPYPIVGFVCQMHLLKSNRRRLLLSLIKHMYKHDNTCLVNIYNITPVSQKSRRFFTWLVFEADITRPLIG